MDISDEDKAFLAEQIRTGNVVLFLGAGANVGATNGKNKPIKTGGELASLLAERTNLNAEDYDLGELVEEFEIKYGSTELLKLFRDEFSDCTPSEAQKNLFSYTWLRVYTLNIDNAIHHIPRARRAQRFLRVNRSDSVEERRNFDDLEIVYLNGGVESPEKGFIFTPGQYRSEIRQSSTWYAKCAVDFFDKVFVFLGTSLNEPVFDAHIEELSRNRGQFAARSFILSPHPVSAIKRRKLLEKRIEPVVGTLESFVAFLKSSIGESLSPADVAARLSGLATPKDTSSALIASVEQLGTPGWASKRRLNETGRRRYARDFFNGAAPSWETLSNDIAVELSHDRYMIEDIKKFIASGMPLFVVLGQSGSGKTTALMKAVLSLAKEPAIKIFALDEGTRESLRNIVKYLAKISDGDKIVLFINNLVLFTDELTDIEQPLRESGVQIVAQSRSRDWEGRISRYAPRMTHIFNMPKLDDADYERLRKGIIDHAVAPKFIALREPARQIAFLKGARRQLLVLMKEATHQRKFEEIIEDEFRSIESAAARVAFCVVGLATFAKNQLSVGELREMMALIDPSLDLGEALTQLDGIVIKGSEGLSGRHEIYVRHIFDIMIDAQQLKDVIVGTLRYFTRFGQPIISKLGTRKGNMFKFIVNADWLYETFDAKRDLKMAERVYSSIEIEYQLDGHYWLQRGLFYRRRRMHKVAQDCFDKSVGAFPNSLFARHAHAQQQLINACVAGKKSPLMEKEVQSAVKELNAQTQSRTSTDQYPLLTLSRFHPEVYLRWGDQETARSLAREYFERLGAFRKSLPREDKSVETAWTNCMALATTGKWNGPRY